MCASLKSAERNSQHSSNDCANPTSQGFVKKELIHTTRQEAQKM